MKLSVQSQPLVIDFGIDTAFRMIREAGFEAIDWNIDRDLPGSVLTRAEKLEGLTIFEKSQEEIAAYYADQLAAIRRNGLEITQAHAPFPSYLPGREDVLDYCIGIFKNILLFLDSVGCKHLIVHGITVQEKDTALTVEECERLNMKLYESLIPTLREAKQIKVCLENLFTGISTLGAGYWEGCCSDPHIAAEWIDRLNEKAGKKCFGLCLDTGHLNLLRKPFRSYVPILGDRIVALHIHDNLQTGDSHLMPYAGSTHWEHFLTELKAVGYCGDLSFETAGQTKTARLPAPLVPAFLRVIAEVGGYFRSELLK
jgi:sugar phosphate isomerase/epimerase